MAWDFTDFAPIAYMIVGIVSAIMAWLTLNSYRNTGNIRLMFVFTAFIAMLIKSVFVVANELSPTHPVSHHSSLVVLGMLDVLIVILFFVPFMSTRIAKDET
jgi:hypothetical protein